MVQTELMELAENGVSDRKKLVSSKKAVWGEGGGSIRLPP